ncbi:glycosyltransferase family 4 protein [Sphingomonas bacterium]|uniref:glycosyltransferase family 4 protein n=1 Tax=Sphingomonas bacterium TaxID=1895847 RepID=UPI001575E1D2|nr:glycosyltransferase family 4 protein [Sphingomonas bacterium]
MRITHAVRQYRPGIGGIETYVSQLAERQARAGLDVRVVTLNRIFGGDGSSLPALEHRNGVTIRRIPFVGGIRYPIAPAVLSRIGDADVVHVHGLEFFADFAALTRRMHRKPMVLSTHGGFFHTPFARRLKRLWFNTVTRMSLSAYSTVLASSVQDEVVFRRIAGNRVALLENAIDVTRFAGLASPGTRTIIFFGRLAPNKGLDRLIAWFAALQAQAPSWRLIVAGKEMGVTISGLHELASKHGVDHAVEFHREPDDDQLRALIARSSVFACASTYEGFGLAAVEAIGAGLFPILSDLAVFERTLHRVGIGMTSDFTPGADVDAFLKQVGQFECDAIRRPTMADRMAPFAWPVLIDRLHQHYACAVAAGPGEPFAAPVR